MTSCDTHVVSKSRGQAQSSEHVSWGLIVPDLDLEFLPVPEGICIFLPGSLPPCSSIWHDLPHRFHFPFKDPSCSASSRQPPWVLPVFHILAMTLMLELCCFALSPCVDPVCTTETIKSQVFPSSALSLTSLSGQWAPGNVIAKRRRDSLGIICP